MPEATPDPVEPTDDSGRERLVSAVRRPARSQVVVAILLACLGFAAVTQVRSNDVESNYDGKREQDLIDLLNALAGTAQKSQNEINRLEATVAQLQDNSNNRQEALAQAQDDLATLDILAGLVKAVGPGLTVTIEDPAGAVDTDTILDTIQELRTAGAEAIEFNDSVRVVAQTSIEAGVGGMVIDGQLVTAPYVIDAIGDPHALEGAMTFFRGPQDDVASEGGTLGFVQSEQVTVDSVRQPVRPRYAEPGDGS